MKRDEHPVNAFSRIARERFADEAADQAHMLITADETLKETRLARIVSTIALTISVIALAVSAVSCGHSFNFF